MRKIFLLATALLFTALGSANEYTNDEYCVYSLNVGEQTACVVNFCSEASSVIIPSSFVYKGDTYVVDGLVNDDFKRRYDSKYCYEDYAENRSCIVELNLPTTLKYIGDDAFEGMTRLKKITIPASVENTYYFFSDTGWFGNNSRLENITFEGIPVYKKSRRRIGPAEYRVFPTEEYEISLIELDNPMAVIDSMKNELRKEGWRRSCSKLQSIEVVPLKEYIFYKDKLDKSYTSYSKRLSDSVSIYQTRLTRHPYYIEDNYFNKITIQKPVLTSTQAKENYTIQSTALRNEYNRQLSLCREEYKKLWNNMEQNCKQKAPNTYADCYCALHPVFSAQIDTLLKDYKCEYTKQRLALCILKNYQLGEKCQDKLWKKYAYLFENKEAFLSTYYNSSNIKNVISMREETYHLFKYFIKESINGKKMKLKGAYAMEGSIGRDFCRNYDKMRDSGIPVSEEIINLDPKAQKEFIKNGQYFDSPDEFFAAYIRSNYSNILKSKKKSKNKS